MKDAPAVKRRSFLAVVFGVPAAAVAATWLARRRAQQLPPLPAAAEESPPSGTYHETEHIRKYYRSADF